MATTGERFLSEGADAVHFTMFDPKVMVAGQLMYVVATVAIYFYFKDVAPNQSLQIWATIAGIGLSISLVFCAAFFLRKPSHQETLRFWRVIDKRLTHVFDIIAVSSIFLLFQHGSEGQRMVALAFCVGYGPMQLVVDPQNILANRISVVTILSAFSLQLFHMNHDSAVILTVLFILYAGLLLYAAGMFYRSYEASVLQKIESETSAKEIAVALRVASASRDAKTQFIASASHDLGHPLQAASLLANALSNKNGSSDDSGTVHLLKKAIHEAQGQVAHMLHYLRLEADAVQPSISAFPLSEIIEEAVVRHGPDAELRKIAIHAVKSKLWVSTDRQLLMRALDNLLVNSLVHSHGSKVLVGCRSKGHDIMLWVIDNGVGIPPSMHSQVFEDFSRGKNQPHGGFGIGLASVRRTMLLLGGTVRIEAQSNNGCAFCMTLKGANR